jgi:hypothetical protein
MRRRLIFAGLVLLLSVPLAFLLRDLVGQPLATRALYLIWLGRLLLHSVHQYVFWVLFLAIALLIVVGALVGEGWARAGQAPMSPSNAQQNPVEILARQIRLLERGDYSRWRLAQSLGELALEALAYHDHLPLAQVRQRLEAGALDAPPEVQAYLQASRTTLYLRPVTLLSRLGLRRKKAFPSPLDLDPERVVQFLEDRLEIHHGNDRC